MGGKEIGAAVYFELLSEIGLAQSMFTPKPYNALLEVSFDNEMFYVNL